MTDIFTVLHTVEVNFVQSFVSLVAGLVQIITESYNAENAAAAGDQFAFIVELGAGVESDGVVALELSAGDDVAFSWCCRIALRGQHDSVEGALKKLVETRIQEGENLKKDLCEKLDGMLAHVDYITERSPQLITEYRQKLEEKVKELLEGSQIEDARIATEVTLYADKICVDEELVRLRSHIVNVKAALLDGDGVGRKLDFMAQEMNREANTILSKSNDLDITNRAIELKTEIEKIREQIQNIE